MLIYFFRENILINLTLIQFLLLFYQTQESLNPNNLEYWMEDIYTPGYDSLLKRKEAEFRRAKVCKIGALIAAATCTVILVIIVPICTMKTWAYQYEVSFWACFDFDAAFTSSGGLSCQHKMTGTAPVQKTLNQQVHNIYCVSIGLKVVVLLYCYKLCQTIEGSLVWLS